MVETEFAKAELRENSLLFRKDEESSLAYVYDGREGAEYRLMRLRTKKTHDAGEVGRGRIMMYLKHKIKYVFRQNNFFLEV